MTGFVCLGWFGQKNKGKPEVIRRSISAIAFACAMAAPVGVAADQNAGAYLAARQAAQASDFTQAARYFAEALVADPTNTVLMEDALAAFLSLGQIDRAVTVAQNLVDAGAGNQVAYLTLSVGHIQNGDWSALFQGLEAGHSIGPLVDAVTQGWAHLAQGDMSRAIASFDRVIANESMAIYGLTHKAYALASVGDFEGAEALFSQNASFMRYSRQSAIAHAQILSQLDRTDDAIAVLDLVFATQMDPAVDALRDQLIAGQSLAYSAVRTPEQGMAELYHAIAGLLLDDAPDAFTLIYARASMLLWPENTPAVLMTARLLENLEQYELANATYNQIAPDDPSFAAAEVGRAEVLRKSGRVDAAIEVFEALTRAYPNRPEIFATKGDTFRQADRFEEAQAAYSRALDLYPQTDPVKWFVYYTRGITHHQLDQWPAAESDFRSALALRPDQPQVLNYLGYSLVERGEKMDEALAMIETAADARPDNGAIVDSLGWVYFQLGRYDEAVIHLEQAASLEPADPVINDHLGDALWAVGRQIEAQFQWQRALSFDPTEADAARIRDKLDRGLDMVLQDEGADPVRIASDDI